MLILFKTLMCNPCVGVANMKLHFKKLLNNKIRDKSPRTSLQPLYNTPTTNFNSLTLCKFCMVKHHESHSLTS